MSKPLWRPSQERIDASALSFFMRFAAERTGGTFPEYASLWRWSVEELEGFWDAVWDFCGVIAETKGGPRVLVIDNWSPHESALDFAELRGGHHGIRVQYYQADGWYELRVEIVRGRDRSPGSPGAHGAE